MIVGVGLVVASLLVAAEATPGVEVTAREYQLYMRWREQRDNLAASRLTDEQQVVRAAAALEVKPSELRQVIAKVEPVQPRLAADTERAMVAALASTPLKERLLEVHVDSHLAHVVAGLKWRCGAPIDRDKEASLAAWAAREAGRIVETLVLWCVSDDDATLFSAKIGRSAFEKIARDGIERFAATRYIKLFEEVRRSPSP
jgi:hypothetical protein